MRALAILLTLVPLAVPSAAQTARPASGAQAQRPPLFDRGRFAIPHHKHVLANGLTLLVHEDHSAPIVAVNLWYHVGSRNEKRGKTGFAHLFEHFFFNGSENYPHGFREAMDDLGANNRNGSTTPDRTNFFEDVPVSALERTLYLEADRMGFLAGHISSEMLQRERGVVQNEKRERENQPYGRVFDRIVETIYPYSHPYSWSVIGSLADLDAASLDDVREWYRTYYGPNNCVLTLAGDISAARAVELVEKYFGGIPPGPPLARAEQWVPRLDGNLRELMQDRVPQARIYRAYLLPSWRDAALPHLELFASVLSGTKSARLDRRLVYEKKLATSVSSFVVDRELASNLVVVATVKPDVDPAAVELELDAVIADLLSQGPTAAELQRAQSRAQAEFVRGIERLGGFEGGRSDVLAKSMTYGGKPDAYLDRLEAVARARPADVKAAAARWVDAPHYTLLVTPFPSLAAGRSDVDRKVLPALTEAPDVKFPDVQRATLSNGLKVILLERHTAPLANVALAVDAGYAADSAEKAGLASLALELMQEGTRSRDAFRVVDELDALGAQINTGSSLDLSFVRLQALSMNLGASLDIFADVVLNPSFPEDMVAIGKRRRLARISQEQSQPTSVALRVVPPLLYGAAHAYGSPLTGSGSARTIESVGREDLVAWHRAWFHPNNSTVIVTGDVTLEKVVPELERVLGGWKAGQPPRKKLEAVPPTTGRKVYLIDRPDAQQSVIMAAHVSEPGGRSEDLAVETVMQLLGGMATSRLNRNLRLDKHWSYGAFAVLTPARGQRPFMVIAPVQTDKTREAMVEVVKELRGIAGERPVAGEEYKSIMRNMTLRLAGRFETLGALENAASQLVAFGYPDDHFARYARNLQALGEPSLASAARAFIRPEEAIWVVVGDLRKVEAGIRELGLGEVVRLGPDGQALAQ